MNRCRVRRRTTPFFSCTGICPIHKLWVQEKALGRNGACNTAAALTTAIE